MNGKVGKFLLGPVLCAVLFPASVLSAQTRVAQSTRPSQPAAQERTARPATPETRRPNDRPEVRPNDRLDNERARIRRGVQSGELTRQEVARLKKELETVQAHERRALKDGT